MNTAREKDAEARVQRSYLSGFSALLVLVSVGERRAPAVLGVRGGRRHGRRRCERAAAADGRRVVVRTREALPALTRRARARRRLVRRQHVRHVCTQKGTQRVCLISS